MSNLASDLAPSNIKPPYEELVRTAPCHHPAPPSIPNRGRLRPPGEKMIRFPLRDAGGLWKYIEELKGTVRECQVIIDKANGYVEKGR